jgi:hypothetical protein
MTNSDGIQEARGWYYIPSGESRKINIANRGKNEVYYLLMDEDGQVFESKIKAVNIATDRDKYFDSMLKQDGKGYTDFSYFSFTPSNKKKTQQLFITGSSVPKISD